MTEKRTTLEIIAPSIEEAIEEGLEKLGLSKEDVEIEILDEGTKGLFGLGSRQSRVKFSVNNDDSDEGVSKDVFVEEGINSEGVSRAQDSIQGEDEVLKIAQETVSELLEKMNIYAEAVAYYGEPDEDRGRTPIHVDIQGQDLSILIGRKAETINAFQYITKLIVGKELAQSVPISVDVEGYRKRRERQIRKLAQRVADQVGATDRNQALEPMPPNERRIVHIELRNNPEVYTQSTGEGQRRKVVIHPKD